MFSSSWALDTGERVVATFVESFLGIWILTGPADVFNLSTAHTAAAAGVIAAAAALKAAIAAKVGSGSSASLAPQLVSYVKPDVTPAPAAPVKKAAARKPATKKVAAPRKKV